MRLLAAVLFVAVTAAAQSAKVVPLSPEDVAQAKQLDADQKALSGRVSKFRNHIVRDYLTTRQEKRGDHIYVDPEGKASWLAAGYFTVATSWTHTGGGAFLCVAGGDVTPCANPEKLATPEEIRQHNAAVAKAETDRQREIAEAKAKSRWILDGWDEGQFEYSSDYLFIVPAEVGYHVAANNCGGITLTGH